MPWAGLAIGAGLGLLKSAMVDAPKAERQRSLAATTQRYSPWTKLAAAPVQEADPFSTALQFGGLGASLVGAKQQADSENAYTDALTRQADQGNLIGGGGKSSSPPSTPDEMTSENSQGGILGDFSPWSGLSTGYSPKDTTKNISGIPGMKNDTRGGWIPINPYSGN